MFGPKYMMHLRAAESACSSSVRGRGIFPLAVTPWGRLLAASCPAIEKGTLIVGVSAPDGSWELTMLPVVDPMRCLMCGRVRDSVWYGLMLKTWSFRDASALEIERELREDATYDRDNVHLEPQTRAQVRCLNGDKTWEIGISVTNARLRQSGNELQTSLSNESVTPAPRNLQRCSLEKLRSVLRICSSTASGTIEDWPFGNGIKDDWKSVL